MLDLNSPGRQANINTYSSCARDFYELNLSLLNNLLESVGFPRLESSYDFNVRGFIGRVNSLDRANATEPQRLLIDYMATCRQRRSDQEVLDFRYRQVCGH